MPGARDLLISCLKCEQCCMASAQSCRIFSNTYPFNHSIQKCFFVISQVSLALVYHALRFRMPLSGKSVNAFQWRKQSYTISTPPPQPYFTFLSSSLKMIDIQQLMAFSKREIIFYLCACGICCNRFQIRRFGAIPHFCTAAVSPLTSTSSHGERYELCYGEICFHLRSKLCIA